MSIPVLPTFLPIVTSSDDDTRNMPVFDSMRGDIVPAIFDSSGNIINNPTPFYILCTAKIINTGNNIPSLPPIEPDGLTLETYEQFGLVQGNKLIFPPTNGGTGGGDNTMTKNQFGLCPFPKAFTQEIYTNLVQKDPSYIPSSPGLLVPVYCYQDTGEYYASGTDPSPYAQRVSPAFFFFRADVFWEGAVPTGNGAYDAYASKIPNYPLGYNDPAFPVPFGKNKNNIYYLSSVYTYNYNDNNRVGTWSLFNTINQIGYINQANLFATGPAAAPVSIAFNLPTSNQSFTPVSRLSTSQLYTVNKMNQYNTTRKLRTGSNMQDIYIQDWCAQTTATGNCWPDTFGNLGYPLNFLYQIGSDSNFTNSVNYSSYYQQGVPSVLEGSYQGTICQTQLPFSENYEGCTNYWDIATVSRLYEGGSSQYTFTTKNIIGGTTYTTSYYCSCAGGDQYNGTCGTNGANTIVSDIGNLEIMGDYYGNTCNSVHAGIFQFTAFQFIPINFYTTPPQRSVPPIGPTGYQSFPGKTGPTGITGPTTTSIPYLTNIQMQVPKGPTGYGNYTISFPFNSNTGASNPFPNTTIPNTVSNITLGNSISNWVANPNSQNCPDQTSPSHPQCGYQDYYHSLLGRFYKNPQDLLIGTVCGLDYTPPWYYDGVGPTGGCTGGAVCTPNYKFLQDITNTKITPFTCQLPQATAPYPQTINGFNFTSENITPITWENLSNYLYIVPPGVQTKPQSFAKQGYYNGLQAALNNTIDPTTHKTQQKSTNPIWIVLIVLIVLVVIILIFYFLLRSSSKPKADFSRIPHYPRS